MMYMTIPLGPIGEGSSSMQGGAARHSMRGRAMGHDAQSASATGTPALQSARDHAP